MATTTTHDDDTCTTEHPCERCAWAEFEQAEDARLTASQAKIAPPPRVTYVRCVECGQFEPCPCGPQPSRFDVAWDTAPRNRCDLVMREDAEYWFRRGVQVGRNEAVMQENVGLQQMIELAQERLR